MLSCLSLTERSENSAASRAIFSKWRDHLVISDPCDRINVNPREFQYIAGKERPPVKETWIVVHHHASRPVLFVTGRDRDNSWCDCTARWTASPVEGSKNSVRHFCQFLGRGDVTLKGPTQEARRRRSRVPRTMLRS